MIREALRAVSLPSPAPPTSLPSPARLPSPLTPTPPAPPLSPAPPARSLTPAWVVWKSRPVRDETKGSAP